MSKRLIVLRAAGCLVIIAVVWELCARVDDHITQGAPLVGAYSLETLYTNDALGIRGRPNARYLKWKLNSLGYRGPELVPGHTRIVCLGASETFGLYEEEGNEYPRQLERQLNARAGTPAIDVVNAAYPGLTMATTLRRLPEILDKVRPRVITIYPSPASYVYLPSAANPLPTAAPANRFELRIAEKIDTVIKASLPHSVQTWAKELVIARAARHETVMDRLPETHIDRFRSDLSRLIDAILEHGVQPVLVTHATRFGTVGDSPDGTVPADEHDTLVAWRRFYPVLAESGFLDMERRINDCMRQVAAERRLPLIDAARQMPGGKRYFADWVHFSDEGVKTMAHIIADGLQPLLIPGRLASSTASTSLPATSQ